MSICPSQSPPIREETDSDGEGFPAQNLIDVLFRKTETQSMWLLQIKQAMDRQNYILQSGQSACLMIHNFIERQAKFFSEFNPRSDTPAQIAFPRMFHENCELFLKNHQTLHIDMPHAVFSAIIGRLRWQCSDDHNDSLRRVGDSEDRAYIEVTFQLKINALRVSVAVDGFYLLDKFAFPLWKPKCSNIIKEYQLREDYKVLGHQVLRDAQMSTFQQAKWLAKRALRCNHYD